MPKIMSDSKRPIYVITGFLGSGKTTLLNHLLNHPEMKDTAVIINEFGEIGIDHLLVKSSLEDAVLLKNGCLCCTIRGDLLDTLETLAIRQEQGDIPKFCRVVIETTGLADPAPILQTLMMDPVITERYVLNSVVTTVDTVNGHDQLLANLEPAKQIAIADLILLTKTDMADPKIVERLTEHLNALNPAADKLKVLNGEIDPTMIFERCDFDLSSKSIDHADWLGETFEQSHPHDVNRHSEEISTFCITRGTPLPWSAVKEWLQSIISLRSQDVLRIKAIVDLEGIDQPVVLHGVQQALHDPVLLDEWQTSLRQSNIVFIGRNLVKSEIEAALERLLSDQAA
jgi:G3E family GTPase